MARRLYRSRDDRVIGGVAAGLADYLDLDPALVRVAWVVLALITGGAAVLIYIVMLIVVPEEPSDEWDWNRPFGAGPATPGPTDAGASGMPGAGTVGSPSGGADATGVSGTGEPPAVPPGEATDASGTTGTSDPGAGGTSSASAAYPVTAPPPAWLSPREQRRAERAARRAARGSSGPGEGALVIGIVLILLGAFFLLRQYVPLLDLGFIWPLAVIGLGVVLLIGALRPGGRTPG